MTKMRRRELVQILRRLQPAIARKDFIPVFVCACFDGKTATAWDDVIAIEVPCDWDFKGALRCNELTKFLRASKSEEPVRAELVDVPAKDGKTKTDCIITMGDTPLTLGVIPAEDFLFTWPTEAGDAIGPGDYFVDRLRKCAVTLGVDPSHPWRMGITVAFDKRRVRFYSSDDHIMTATTLDRDVPAELVGQAFILPPRFCTTLLSMDRSDPASTINFHEKHVQAIFPSGAKLYSRLIEEINVEMYEDLVGKYDEADMMPIPPGLKGALEKANSVLSTETLRRSTVRTVQGELGAFLQLKTLSALRNVTTKLPIDPDAAEAEMISYPDLLLRVLPGATEMRLFETAIVLRGPDVLRLVAIFTPNDGEPKQRVRRVTASDRLRVFLTDLFADGEPRPAADVLAAIDEAGCKLSTETIAHVRRSCRIGTRKVKGGWEWFSAEAIQDQDQPLEKAS